MLQVSSRMSGYAEVWELTRSSWDQMPQDLSFGLLGFGVWGLGFGVWGLGFRV